MGIAIPSQSINALNWLNRNLQLGWPMDKVEKPQPVHASRSTTLEAKPCSIRPTDSVVAASAFYMTGSRS